MKKSLILALISAAGVIATAVMASKAGSEAAMIKMYYQRQRDISIPKKASEDKLEPEVVSEMLSASKKLERKELWRIYIPTAMVTVGTAALILLGYKQMSSRFTAVSSLAAMESGKLRQYRKKVREICPDGTDEKIIAEIAKDDYCCYPRLPANDNDQNKFLFYDYYSKRFFYATPARVREAIYHLNRNFQFWQVINVNEFYNFIGIPEIPFGDNLKWFADVFWENGYMGTWIDINTVEETIDGKKCLALYFDADPMLEEEFEKEYA